MLEISEALLDCEGRLVNLNRIHTIFRSEDKQRERETGDAVAYATRLPNHTLLGNGSYETTISDSNSAT